MKYSSSISQAPSSFQSPLKGARQHTDRPPAEQVSGWRYFEAAILKPGCCIVMLPFGLNEVFYQQSFANFSPGSGCK
jgi:hypothetical protein